MMMCFVGCTNAIYQIRRKENDYGNAGRRWMEVRTMSVEQMRDWLKRQYGGSWKWVNKVNAMHDGQVIAVYYRLSRESKHK